MITTDVLNREILTVAFLNGLGSRYEICGFTLPIRNRQSWLLMFACEAFQAEPERSALGWQLNAVPTVSFECQILTLPTWVQS